MDVSPEEKQNIKMKIERLQQSKFKQQTMPVHRPNPTPMSAIITLCVFGFLFMSIGVSIWTMSEYITEIEKRYDDVDDCMYHL